MVAPWHSSLTISSVQSEDITGSEIESWPQSIRIAWLHALTRDDSSRLARRLKWDSLDANAILQWSQGKSTAESDSANSIGLSWQPWLEELQRVLRSSWDLPLRPYKSEPQVAFIDIWLPVLNWSQGVLSDRIRSLGIEPNVNDSAYADLGFGLIQRLGKICESSLWSEFCKYRSFGSSFLAYLGSDGTGSGEPVREKYKVFVERHRRNGLVELLIEYPVLARLIGTETLKWIDTSIELLHRITLDREQIELELNIPRRARLECIKQSVSDFHNGGRQVAILRFCDEGTSAIGSCFHLVYKPRDMGLDAAFQKAVSKLNSDCDLPPLKTLAVLNKGGYGYMEYIQHKPCEDSNQLSRFYGNAGRLAALLYVLCCTDCHHENFIAHGEHLVLIDAETLFEPDLLDDNSATNAGQKEAPRWTPLQKRYQRSVLRTGVLPVWTFVGAERTPVDISALGISAPTSAQYRTRGWIGINTDGMLYGTVNNDSSLPTSLPTPVGIRNAFLNNVSGFCSGFKQQCEYFLETRRQWLDQHGILNTFAGLQRRFIFRSTSIYLRLQSQQLSTNALRSAFDQAMTIEQLARSFLIHEERPDNWPLFSAESSQMNQLDIPYFVHHTDGTSLCPVNGLSESLPYFTRSGLENSRNLFEHLDNDTIEFQLRLIRGSCEAKQLRSNSDFSLPGSLPLDNQDKVGLDGAIPGFEIANTAAQRLARYILEIAISDSSGNVEWLGMDLQQDGQTFGFGPVGSSLYGGSIGVACFLDSLLREQIEVDIPLEISRCSSRDIVESILAPIDEVSSHSSAGFLERWWRDQPLGLAGTGGILLALHSLGKQSMLDKLLLGLKPHFLEDDIHLDIVSGCAGLVGALLLHGSDHSLHLANIAGKRLLAAQCQDGSWRSSSAKSHALLGFSHGTAGFASSLARLYAVTGNNQYLQAASRALAYERSRFSDEHMNWPDFRYGQPRYQSTWCHGAPGIALSRACLLGTDLFDRECLSEINIALQTTALAVDHASGNHLCCGNLGLAAIMRSIWALPISLESDTQTACEAALAKVSLDVLNRSSQNRPSFICLSTDEGSLALPGFFNGLSGMGMSLLGSEQSQARTAMMISAGLYPC